MGVVHLAEAADGSRVALKVLRQHIIGDRESRQRLAREVASLQLVTSPRVAEVIDAYRAMLLEREALTRDGLEVARADAADRAAAEITAAAAI